MGMEGLYPIFAAPALHDVADLCRTFPVLTEDRSRIPPRMKLDLRRLSDCETSYPFLAGTSPSFEQKGFHDSAC